MKEIAAFLAFDGHCREAMEFYKNCFGADLFLLPYSEAPGDFPWVPEEAKDRIMHSTLSKGSTILMAADSLPGVLQRGNDFSVIVHCESLQEIADLFDALGEKGQITMPLQDTFWGARYGTLTDRFGIRWMFNFAHPK